jgi:hypothetical protein
MSEKVCGGKTNFIRDTECRVEINPSANKILVREVKGSVFPKFGDEVEYEVTQYNINIAEVSDEIKKSVKWKTLINGETDDLTIDGKAVTGDKIKFKVPADWIGETVTLMPYLNKWTENISWKAIVDGGLIVTTDGGKELFRLDGSSRNLSGKITVRELYKIEGINWFEPDSDNYIPLLSIASDITSRAELKHFTWEQVVEFAEINRPMIAYHSKVGKVFGTDWKTSERGADGYPLVTIDGIPYWADAIGQIPFAVDYYTDLLERTGNEALAEKKTIEIGKLCGGGTFGSEDRTNSYDNAMIKRAIDWCKKRYAIGKKRVVGLELFGDNSFIYDLIKTDYAPIKLSFEPKR